MRAELWTSIAGMALVVTACNEQSNEPLSAVSAASELHSGVPDITGAVLGPDGTSVCNFVPEGTAITVRAIEVSTLAFGVIGYRLTVLGLLLFYLGGVERKPLIATLLVSFVIAFGSYALFVHVLKVSLPSGPWGL